MITFTITFCLFCVLVCAVFCVCLRYIKRPTTKTPDFPTEFPLEIVKSEPSLFPTGTIVQGNPMDCIFNQIMKDFETIPLDRWTWRMKERHQEYISPPHGRYSIVADSQDEIAWLDGVIRSRCFSSSQQKILYKKTQEVWKTYIAKKEKVMQLQEQERLAKQFPECFPTLDVL
jgi:hypothetical protein